MSRTSYVDRSVESHLIAALEDTPVAVVNGPRQAGKSTLIEHLASSRPSTAMVTLDSAGERVAAQSDPEGYVLQLHQRLRADTVAIDEVQLAPELFRALKLAVDRDRRPGRFVLTGSTRLLSLPKLSDSLAGRMEVIDLWPFTQGELAGRRDTFLDAAFRHDLPAVTSPLGRGDLVERALAGGFPPVLERPSERRQRWLTSYVRAVVDRDLGRC